MPVSFYRAVSFAELDDIRTCGHLRITAGSCEGKHLACVLAHARRWGEALHGKGSFAVIRVTVDEAVAAKFDRWARLDGIGPACFATMDLLVGAQIAEVTDDA